ncbi:hypothetical protein MRX96_010622 [Rhipicephalus microplus]
MNPANLGSEGFAETAVEHKIPPFRNGSSGNCGTREKYRLTVLLPSTSPDKDRRWLTGSGDATESHKSQHKTGRCTGPSQKTISRSLSVLNIEEHRGRLFQAPPQLESKQRKDKGERVHHSGMPKSPRLVAYSTGTPAV